MSLSLAAPKRVSALHHTYLDLRTAYILLVMNLLTHSTKSIWQPTWQLAWLGFVVDVALGQIEIPQKKNFSSANPTQASLPVTWQLASLGLVVDVALGQIQIPQKNISALRTLLRRACQSRHICAKRLASIV